MVTLKALNPDLTLKHNILHTLSPGRCQNVGVWQNIQHGVQAIWNWCISKHMSMHDHAYKNFFTATEELRHRSETVKICRTILEPQINVDLRKLPHFCTKPNPLVTHPFPITSNQHILQQCQLMTNASQRYKILTMLTGDMQEADGSRSFGI